MDTASFYAPTHVSERMFYGVAIDLDGTGADFEDDEALGSGTASTHNFTITPAFKYIRLETVRYLMNQTNAVTYQLHLIEDRIANAYTEQSRCLFSSGAAQADNTLYLRSLDANDLPCLGVLDTPGTVEYKVHWSGAPGDTPGFVRIMGVGHSGV